MGILMTDIFLSCEALWEMCYLYITQLILYGFTRYKSDRVHYTFSFNIYYFIFFLSLSMSHYIPFLCINTISLVVRKGHKPKTRNTEGDSRRGRPYEFNNSITSLGSPEGRSHGAKECTCDVRTLKYVDWKLQILAEMAQIVSKFNTPVT